MICVCVRVCVAHTLFDPSSCYARTDYALLTCFAVQSSSASDEEIAKCFKLFDNDATGSITLKNLFHARSILGMDDVTDAQLENMMKQADRSGSGSISLADFVRLMRKKGKGLVGCDEPDEDDITDAMAEALLPDPLSAARRQALMKVRLCGWW